MVQGKPLEKARPEGRSHNTSESLGRDKDDLELIRSTRIGYLTNQ